MTEIEKTELRRMVNNGLKFKDIRPYVKCSDGTIRKYLRSLGRKTQV